MVWSYIGELIFNMLVLVGTIKMSDRIVKEMMGLYYVASQLPHLLIFCKKLIIIYTKGSVNYA